MPNGKCQEINISNAHDADNLWMPIVPIKNTGITALFAEPLSINLPPLSTIERSSLASQALAYFEAEEALNAFPRRPTYLEIYNNRFAEDPNGPKLTTLIKRLAPPELANAFTKAVSMARNSGSEATLYISSHPLDFATLSLNDNGWSTCLSHGYKLGPHELAHSTHAIVAYTANKTPMTLPDGTQWNNKKWREVYFVGENFVVESKPYPYRCDRYSKAVIEFLQNLWPHLTYFTDKATITTHYNYMYNNDGASPIYADALHPKKRWHYALYVRESEGIVLHRDRKSDEVAVSFDLNEKPEVICPQCRKTITYNKHIIGQKSNILCPECAKITKRCECCGKLCFDNSIVELETVHRFYCEECSISKCDIDDIDTLLYPSEYLIDVYLTTIPDHPSPSDKVITIVNPYSDSPIPRPYALTKYIKALHKTIMKATSGHYSEVYYANPDERSELI